VDDCTCDDFQDHAGNLLFQHDDDDDPSTPDLCAGFDYELDDPDPYIYYAYDAVYAFAHAAQALLDDGKTQFDGPAMAEALKDLEFEGVTGPIEFEANGDREVGVGYSVLNFQGGEEGWATLGFWTVDDGLVYADGLSLEDVVWPTANGEQPEDTCVQASAKKGGRARILVFGFHAADHCARSTRSTTKRWIWDRPPRFLLPAWTALRDASLTHLFCGCAGSFQPSRPDCRSSLALASRARASWP
jgi:hypothetical protein